MSSVKVFSRVIPEEYHGRILTGDYSAGLKDRVAGIIGACQAFERTGNPSLFYLSAWDEHDAGRLWYEYASSRFAALMKCRRSQVADAFRSRILDRRTLRVHESEAGIEEEIRDRASLDESALELRESWKQEGVGDAVYKLDMGGGAAAWIKDVARIEVHPEDRVCLSCGTMTLVTNERLAEEYRLERERLRVSLEMAGAVCHEMNQPLQGISGYAEAMLMGLPEEDPLGGKLRKITELAGKLGEITRKLTRITKYETKDYIQGVKIVDLDKSSGGNSDS